MTLPSSKFGTKPNLGEDFMKKGNAYVSMETFFSDEHTITVAKSSIIENVLSWAKFKADQQIKKTDGSKRTRYAS